MRTSTKSVFAILSSLGMICILATASMVGAMQLDHPAPVPKLIILDPETNEYMRLLGGPPETVTMHSGLVILDPGKSVGTHNTEKYEEVLLVLEGEGEMVITNGPILKLRGSTLAYCPPRTEHNVVNTGKGRLRYVYIVANAE